MKKLSTVSLFIFAIIVTAILVAGLVFYQNNKNSSNNTSSGNKVSDVINQIKSSGKSVTLNMSEISKHDRQADCWMLIDGKVYDITSFFGSHPGGNSTMSATCGKDATDAYLTKDPNATTASGGKDHSSKAYSMLSSYYLGDFNQTINSEVKANNGKTTNTNSSVTSSASSNTATLNVAPSSTTTSNVKPVGNITLSIAEVSKHSSSSDCWMLISGKVYNITSFFGSHPGGNSTMISSCGKDATAAYMTKDPNANSSSGRSAHSSNAVSMLSSYYIGDLNQNIGQQQITQTNSVVAPQSRGDEDEDDDD